MINMNCPGCGQELKISDADTQSTSICEHCGIIFHVQNPSVAGLVPPPLSALDAEPASNREGSVDLPRENSKPPDLGSSPRAEFSPLGYGHWLIIFLIPPLGVLTSILAPSNHPEKIRAIATSFAMMGVGIALFVFVNFWITDLVRQYDLGWVPEVPEEEITFRDETVELLLAGNNEAILSRVKVPTISGVEFESIAPYGLTDGPFAHEDISGLAFFSGRADEVYEQVVRKYKNALDDSGWIVENVEKSSRGTINTTNFTGNFKGKTVFMKITESSVDVKVTFITRHN
jgi:hypothetical protein